MPKPRFPLYIPSKSRAQSRLTVKALEAMGADFHVVIEEAQHQEYARVIDPAKLLVLDPAYQRDYDTCDHLGDSLSKGPGPARNFIWDHAQASGAEWHWTMDDNIRHFYRACQNRLIRVGDATIFRCMEDFCLRYENVGMAGPNYEMFLARRKKAPPVVFNTRIYSCNLIRNDLPFRWRGRYGEDTDLSLRMLKAGWCTIQFNAFLQQKITTQRIRGGNTEAFYSEKGTLPKSQMLVDQHPDVASLVFRYGRWHHHVDYAPFKTLQLIRKPDLDIPQGVDNYGMELTSREVAHG